jgi:hypothetical protein
VRVEQGSLEPDVVLDARALGLPSPGGEPVAFGMVSGLMLGDGAADVPFDLLPALLPPRVLEVVPGDGDVLDAACTIDGILIVLNKPVDPRTALAPGAITFDPGGAPRSLRVDDTARFIDVVPPSWDFTAEARYTLSISSAVTDLDGVPLDQVPSLDDPQPYEHQFVLPCGP